MRVQQVLAQDLVLPFVFLDQRNRAKTPWGKPLWKDVEGAPQRVSFSEGMFGAVSAWLYWDWLSFLCHQSHFRI